PPPCGDETYSSKDNHQRRDHYTGRHDHRGWDPSRKSHGCDGVAFCKDGGKNLVCTYLSQNNAYP
ncbi:hypothetical protein AVEN_213156-1, partial [Araneus ventricosus]